MERNVWADVRTVLFDFDGTLVHTEPIGPKVFSDLLEEFGRNPTVELHRFKCVWRRQDTTSDPQGVIADAVGGRDGFVAAAKFWDRFSAEALVAPESPGASALLEELAASGRILALVSHARRKDLMPQLEARGWNGFFTFVHPFDDFTAPKPDPSCYLEVMTRLRAQVSTSLVVEDSGIGLAAAASAGISAVHAGCKTSRETCALGPAVVHAPQMADLLRTK